jgi:hypothetical protein
MTLSGGIKPLLDTDGSVKALSSEAAAAEAQQRVPEAGEVEVPGIGKATLKDLAQGGWVGGWVVARKEAMCLVTWHGRCWPTG